MNVFPRAAGPPNHLDVVSPDVETLRLRAYKVFYAMPAQVQCCLFDSIIIIQNPEKDGTLESRARHLTHGWKDGKPIIDVEKCRWLPETINTLQHAAAVIHDPQEGNVLFARQYSGHNIHFVVVRPTPSGFKRGQIGGFLITQFLHARGNRQEVFRLRWKRMK